MEAQGKSPKSEILSLHVPKGPTALSMRTQAQLEDLQISEASIEASKLLLAYWSTAGYLHGGFSKWRSLLVSLRIYEGLQKEYRDPAGVSKSHSIFPVRYIFLVLMSAEVYMVQASNYLWLDAD